MKNKPLIFLSYARDDQDAVKTVYENLRSKGYGPWMDQFDILPGENWERILRIAIQKADFFLIFLSPLRLIEGGFCRKKSARHWMPGVQCL